MSDQLVLFPPNGDLPQAAGGKALALQRLTKAGFNPPDFFVVLPSAFSKKGLAAEQKTALETALANLGEGPFAVRSSGAQEDSKHHSHAGQFLSLLNVKAKDVAKAAHKVWQSGHAGSVQSYRKTHGLSEADPAPAVIVQRMVNAVSAGVAFSADPLSGLRHRVVVSAVKGLGDKLVGGEEDGETWHYDKLQARMITAPQGEAALTAEQASKIAKQAITIETAFNAPQDIEWAFDAKTLHILQARPITTPLQPKPNTDEQIIILDNSNIVESYPGLVSPLTYSFARYAYSRVYRAFVRMVGVSEQSIADNSAVFDNMLARVDGRVYYNLVNWYRALALLPGFSINRHHMESMMGVSEPLPENITSKIGAQPAAGLGKVAEYGRMAKGAGHLLIEAFRLPRTITKFYARLEQAIGPQSLALETASLSQLAREYRRIETLLLDKWDAPIVNDFLCMMAFGASRKLMQKWFGDAGLEMHNHVMIGQGNIISAEPAKRIAEMGAIIAQTEGLAERIETSGIKAIAESAALKTAFDSYIAKFGDRCTQELKLESATLDEEPAPLLAAIISASRRHNNPQSNQHKADLSFDNLTKGKWLRGPIAKIIVSWAKSRVRDRENLRFERTRIFGRARKVFMAIGRELTASGHLAEPRDVLFLTVEEVLGAIEGFGLSQDLRAIVSLRKAEWQQSQTHEDPAERLTIVGPGINVASLIGSIATAEFIKRDADNSASQKTGTACSAGKVTAIARVVNDPSKQSLAAGDILVARHTDPGWIAVFSNASAIVVERGSLLSHSAIVAREMGIPCVVALKDATRWIKDGETITVDGRTGTVTKHSS